jgi:hypothetical protein
MLAGGGVAMSGWALLVPSYPLFPKIALFVFGVAFVAAAILIPNFLRKNTPRFIVFDLAKGLASVVMDNGSSVYLVIQDIEDFEIVPEKRSPSAANSAGINYIHYHINWRRRNGATWTITTSTNQQEAMDTLSLLKRMVLSCTENPGVQATPLPNNIHLQTVDPTEIQWQHGSYRLALNGPILEYTERTASGSIKVKSEFPLSNFSRVTYSYNTLVKSRHSTVHLFFRNGADTPEVKLSLFFAELNPVECLKFELWLHKEITETRTFQ